MKAGQRNIVEVLEQMDNFFGTKHLFRDDPITNITFETNGTRKLHDLLRNQILVRTLRDDTEFFFSVSPKIWSTSGEKDRICPDVVKGYYEVSTVGQLKFVCNGSIPSWREIEDAVDEFKDAGVKYPIWIMPVGATEESQNEDRVAKIAEETMDRGYNVSARVHCYISS
jgi:hypothetical protein